MLTSEQHPVVPDELGSGGLQVEQDMGKWYQFEGFRAIKPNLVVMCSC
jgi:hypothetical protein